MDDQNKAMKAAKTEEEKDDIVSLCLLFILYFKNITATVHCFFNLLVVHILSKFSLTSIHLVDHYLQKTQKQSATFGLKSCNNILAMAQVNAIPLSAISFLNYCVL